jgi:sarcosine oxidase subunit gamma
VAKLIAKSAAEGLLPVQVGAMNLKEPQISRITAIAPYPGREAAVAQALARAGLGWPQPDRSIVNGRAAILWSGRLQAFLFNAPPDAVSPADAALTDVTDGWAGLTLDGRGASQVLARLVPIDLRLSRFPEGATARTALGHMMILLHRRGAERFALVVFRSMVATAVHEIEVAMRAVAARGLA